MNNIVDFLVNLNQETIINLIIALGIIAVFDILSPLFSYAVIKIFNFSQSKEKIKKNAFYLPLNSFFRVLGIYLGIILIKPIFNFSEETMHMLTKIFKITVILTTAVGLSRSITRNSKFISTIKRRSEREIDDTTAKFMVRFIRIAIYIIAIFMIITDLGYNLNGLITGLGLGSVVVTLAAQDVIKNLFGGIVIFADKPFKVGDYIKFGKYEGTVEDITFRSTKLRTLENSIAQIPNAEVSSTTVVNISKIQNRRYTLDLGLVLNTSLEKMKKLEINIFDYLANEEIVVEDSQNVFFKEIGSSEYKLFIYCYLKVVEYEHYLAAKEKLNYEIMKIVNKNNIELAYETKTIEIKNT